MIEVLEKSDRKIEYQQYDLKVEQCRIDGIKRTVTYVPSREDSYERLLEENRQFAAESALSDLERSGHLCKKQRWRENGGKGSNMFYLKLDDSG